MTNDRMIFFISVSRTDLKKTQTCRIDYHHEIDVFDRGIDDILGHRSFNDLLDNRSITLINVHL